MKHSRNSVSRFVPILLVIVITIVAVAAVIAIGRALLGGGQSTEPTTDADEGRTALLSSDVSRSVQLTVRGPIVADEKFRSYRITISPESRTMTTYEGYLEKSLDTKKFDNNTRAYEELIFALDKRKMMDGTVTSDAQNDLRGVCASNKLYEFETQVNGETVKKLWTSDCSGAPGTSEANVAEILDMFLKQIPDGKSMASGVGLAQADTFFSL